MNFPIFLRDLILSVPRKISSLFVDIFNQYFALALPIKIVCPALVAIICMLHQIINNPDGAINTFMIFLFDNFYGFFPSTPEQFKIANMLNAFATDYPNIGWGVVYEIFNGMGVMFGLWGGIKILKILPFT